MLPRIAELLLFGILPFLVGSLATSSDLRGEDEFPVSEISTYEDADPASGPEDTTSIDGGDQPTRSEV